MNLPNTKFMRNWKILLLSNQAGNLFLVCLSIKYKEGENIMVKIVKEINI